jgi:hypothetical protein
MGKKKHGGGGDGTQRKDGQAPAASARGAAPADRGAAAGGQQSGTALPTGAPEATPLYDVVCVGGASREGGLLVTVQLPGVQSAAAVVPGPMRLAAVRMPAADGPPLRQARAR